MKTKPRRSRGDHRLELTKVLVGGGVLALLVVAYLLHSGDDQRHLLDIIGMGLAYALGARGGRTG